MNSDATEQERFKKVSAIVIAGGVANGVLAAVKIGTGTFTGYLPLTAAGFHALSDIVADAAAWITLRLGAKGADHRFHYGRRRIETLTALFAAFFLVYVAVELVIAAFGGGHDHGMSAATLHEGAGEGAGGAEHHDAETHGAAVRDASDHEAEGLSGPTLLVGAVALLALAVKETLFQLTRSKGIHLHSPMLIAKAWHHRVDSFNSAAILLSLLALYLFPSFELVEAITTAVIACVILHSAWEVGSSAVKELIDLAPSRKTLAVIEEVVEKVEDVTFVQNIRIRTMGGALYVELAVEVVPDRTVAEGYAIAQDIRDGVMARVDNVVDVTTLVAPRGAYVRQLFADS